MDIYCPKCGEPWDHDTLHDVAQKRYLAEGHAPFYDRRAFHKNPDYNEAAYQAIFQGVKREFQTNGCSALGYVCSTPSTDTDSTFGLTRQEAAAALYDILGDDMDGAAAMLDDLYY